jgi:hypothetical protein
VDYGNTPAVAKETDMAVEMIASEDREYRVRSVDAATHTVVLTRSSVQEHVVATCDDERSATMIATALNEAEGL